MCVSMLVETKPYLWPDNCGRLVVIDNNNAKIFDTLFNVIIGFNQSPQYTKNIHYYLKKKVKT